MLGVAVKLGDIELVELIERDCDDVDEALGVSVELGVVLTLCDLVPLGVRDWLGECVCDRLSVALGV